MHLVDNFLNKFTMYFVVLWGLRIIVAWSVILSVFGFITYKPLNLIFSFCLLVAICFLANKLFAIIFKVPENKESWTITALILYLVLLPINSIDSAFIFVIAGTLAMASKYLIAPNKRHIFNPAAFGLAVIGLIGSGQAQWWVATMYMFPVVLIIGLIIVRKIRRFHLFLTFVIVSFLTYSINALLGKQDVVSLWSQIFFTWPIFFLGSVMLVEPITTPPTKRLQMIYASIVGILTGIQFHFGPIYSSLELSLILGNVFSYAVSFKYRLVLTLKEKIELSPNIYEFIFSSNRKFAYLPGQYLEWTLGHKKSDNRGIRRYFSLASAPTEKDVRIGIRVEKEKGSSYKKALMNLKVGSKLFAGELTGDFVLPKKENKYVFIAGGIGITPFRSIIKNAIDKSENLDAVLFYSSSSEKDFVFKDVFDSASSIGLKTVYIASHPSESWKGKSGRIDEKMIKEEVPDFNNRIYYLSGPNSMVESYKKLLRSLGIMPHKIVTDYFPGY